MDYNKIMAELDKEVFKSNSAFESAEGVAKTEDSYDEVEKELEEGLGVKGPYVEVEGEEDLVFDDGEGKAPEEEKENPKDLLVRAVNEYLTSLLDGGIEAEKAVEAVKELVKSTLPKIIPIGGIIMSFTIESTMLLKDAPIMIPTAISRTLPRKINSLNSLAKFLNI